MLLWLALLGLGSAAGREGNWAESAEFHRNVSSAALAAVARSLVLRDPDCVELLAGFQQSSVVASWSLADLANRCQITTDGRNVEEAIDAVAWAAALPAADDAFQGIRLWPPTGNPDPPAFRTSLIRLRALVWKLLERGDVGPARHKLGLLLHALQGLARLAVRSPAKARALLDAFGTEELRNLGLRLDRPSGVRATISFCSFLSIVVVSFPDWK